MKTREVNGLFGKIEVSAAGKTKFTKEGTTNPLEDYVFRKTGLQQSLVNAERYKMALDDPSKYLTAKQANLEEIGTRLTNSFSAEYERQLDLGYTEEKARKLTTEYIMKERDRQMITHNQTFPTTVTSDVVQSAFNLKGRKGNTGATGAKGDKGDDGTI